MTSELNWQKFWTICSHINLTYPKYYISSYVLNVPNVGKPPDPCWGIWRIVRYQNSTFGIWLFAIENILEIFS